VVGRLVDRRSLGLAASRAWREMREKTKVVDSLDLRLKACGVVRWLLGSGEPDIGLLACRDVGGGNGVSGAAG
jgi:hypothetical protein